MGKMILMIKVQSKALYLCSPNPTAQFHPGGKKDRETVYIPAAGVKELVQQRLGTLQADL